MLLSCVYSSILEVLRAGFYINVSINSSRF